MTHLFKRTIVILLTLALFIPPGQSKAGIFDADVSLPIPELQGLIQQLQDAGNQVVGNAGIEIRQSIDELSSQVAQRIDQIHAAGKDLLNTATNDLKSLINNLITQVKGLLVEVNNIIKGDIRCIDASLAQRISQVADSLNDILNHVDQVLKQTIDQVFLRANQ